MVAVLRHALTPRILFTLLFEVAAFVTLAGVLPVALGQGGAAAFAHGEPFLWALWLFLDLAAVQFSLWSFGLYSREIVYAADTDLLRRLLAALAFAATLLLPLHAFGRIGAHPAADLSPHLEVAGFLAFALAVSVERYLLLRLLDDTPYLGRILILGTGPATDEVIREARKRLGRTFQAAGILTLRPTEVGSERYGVPVVGTIAEIRDHVDRLGAGAILVALREDDPHLPTDFLLRCKFAGIHVRSAADFYEAVARKVLLESFSPVEFLYRRNLLMTRLRWFAKTTFEKSAALGILVLAWPLMLLAAAAIRLTSPGPVLFRQERVGKDGRRFVLVKFRSMRVDAEKVSGPAWAQERDPRVTPVGRILRKTRIDELPQVFNILKGEMSIVGPRPERPCFVEELRESIPFYDYRHLVKPGLTGWAQVAFRYSASLEDSEEKLRHDLYYIKHMSLGFDLLILVMTLKIVVAGSGAR